MKQPSLDDESRASLAAAAADEFAEAARRGEKPDVEQYVARYPAIADLIRDVFPALSSLEPVDMAATAADQRPRQLGDFRLLREIGRGGMGVVYQAQQLSLSRSVAVKVLPLAGLLDDRQLTRFKNEAAAAATLCHPNIVPIYSVGVERGIHFYAMHWVRGQSLSEIIRDLKTQCDDIGQQTHAPSNDTVRDRQHGLQATVSTRFSRFHESVYQTLAELGIQAADALDHAHAHGIVHRDIKPGNLLVDEQGKLWVTDFGLAQIETGGNLTLTGDLLGTLRYMSPEQAVGQRGLTDQRSDVYSLGATLYELLTLTPVHADEDRCRLLLRIAHDQPVAPRKYVPSIPAELETILLKSLQKNPAFRYQTARDLADDLRRFVAKEPIRARPLSTRQRMADWMWKHPTPMVSSLIVLVFMVLVLSTLSLQFSRQRRETLAALASEREQRRRGDDHLARARDTISKAFLQELQRMGDAPLMTQTQTRLVEEIVEYYEQLPKEDSGSAEVRAEAAKAWSLLAVAYDRLGKTNPSSRARKQAGDLLRRLCAERPANETFRADLVSNMIASGDALRKQNQIRPALQQYQAAMTSQTAETKTPSARWLQQRAMALQKVALCYRKLANAERAETCYQQSIRCLLRRLAEDDVDLQTQYELAVVESDYAAFLQVEKGDSSALDYYERAIARCDQLSSSSPTNVQYRSLAAGLQNDFGLYRMQKGDVQQARAAFRRAVELWKQLTVDFPHRPLYLKLLVGGANNLGGLLHDQREFVEAERVFREACLATEMLASQYPQIAAHHELHAGTLSNLSQVLYRRQLHEEQERVAQLALDVWQRLARQYPDQPSYRAQLAMGHYAVAQRQPPADALQRLKKAIVELRTLVEQYPDVPLYQSRWTTCLNALGNDLMQLKEFEQAQPQLQKSLQVAEQLATRWPAIPDYHGKVVRRLRHLGNLYLLTGQADQAVASYREAIVRQEELRRKFPEYSRPMYVSPAASLHAALATAITRQAKSIDKAAELPAEARAHYELSAQLAQQSFPAMARQIAPVIGEDGTGHLLAAYHRLIESRPEAE